MPRWTQHTRQQQRERILHQRPWLESTGPVTSYGKQVASRNASKKKKLLSQQLHSDFTPGCENAAESDTDRLLEIGDCVIYIGTDRAIASVCQGKLLEIFAVQADLARCWVSGVPGLVTVPLLDLLQHGGKVTKLL